jgi:hypothetical protein
MSKIALVLSELRAGRSIEAILSQIPLDELIDWKNATLLKHPDVRAYAERELAALHLGGPIEDYLGR